jgi:hypothetical protein
MLCHGNTYIYRVDKTFLVGAPLAGLAESGSVIH